MRAGVTVAILTLLGCSGGGGGGGPPTVVGDAGGGDGGGGAPLKVVFVTSTETTSNLGSVQAADERCAVRAGEAGLPGTFRAWFSDSSSSPSTRFTRSEGPYVSVTGTVIAAGWAGLTSGALKVSIDRDEFGEQTTLGLTAWTGTAADGAATGENCDDWSGNGQATIGDITALGSSWTALPNPGDCGGFRHLYCVEQ